MLFRDNEGNWVSFAKIHKRHSLKKMSKRSKLPDPLDLTTKKLSARQKKAGVKANEVVVFNPAIAPTPEEDKKGYGSVTPFCLQLELPQPPLQGAAWRTNASTAAAAAAAAAAADASRGNGKVKSNGGSKGGDKGKSPGK